MFTDVAERINAFPTHTLKHFPFNEPCKHQLILLLRKVDNHIIHYSICKGARIMGREFELKYRATGEQLESIEAFCEGFREIRMETTYYDTPDGTLRQLRWTLRRRMENGISVCTVKSNLGDGSRGEWETKCNDILAAVPQLIALGAPEALAEYTRQGVVPTCGARFTRKAVTLPAGTGAVELALDQGVLLGGGKELPFAEVEVELKLGRDEDAVAFAAELAARFGLTPEPKSKLRRALDLAGK